MPIKLLTTVLFADMYVNQIIVASTQYKSLHTNTTLDYTHVVVL